MVHFNWLQLVPKVTHDNLHVVTFAVSSLVLFGFAVKAKLALGAGEKAVLPSDKFSVRGFFELFTEFIANLTIMVAGKEALKFVPVFASIFLLILVNNLVGLLPGMTPATDNVNTTFALGIFAFLIYNWRGLREHGLSYFKQLFGPGVPKYLFFVPIMMFFIELISHTVRPLSLALRLKGNMVADHSVLGAFLDMAPFLVPIPFYFLGLFVCFMQAFVFTVLTMIYVSMAISHDH